jgi:ribosome maturation factor RimP
MRWARPTFFMESDRGKRQIREVVRALVEPVVLHAGMELVDVEYGPGPSGLVLRLIIDRPGGVTLDDCTYIGHLVGDLLDGRDPVPGRYNLEVSSPGINRPLKKREDFGRFADHKVLIKTREPINGRRNFRGILQGIKGDLVLVSSEEVVFAIPFDKIAKARLDII